MDKVQVDTKLVRDGSLSIRINKALKEAMEVIAGRKDNSLADYVEELVIKDLEYSGNNSTASDVLQPDSKASKSFRCSFLVFSIKSFFLVRLKCIRPGKGVESGGEQSKALKCQLTQSHLIHPP